MDWPDMERRYSNDRRYSRDKEPIYSNDYDDYDDRDRYGNHYDYDDRDRGYDRFSNRGSEASHDSRNKLATNV